MPKRRTPAQSGIRPVGIGTGNRAPNLPLTIQEIVAHGDLGDVFDKLTSLIGLDERTLQENPASIGDPLHGALPPFIQKGLPDDLIRVLGGIKKPREIIDHYTLFDDGADPIARKQNVLKAIAEEGEDFPLGHFSVIKSMFNRHGNKIPDLPPKSERGLTHIPDDTVGNLPGTTAKAFNSGRLIKTQAKLEQLMTNPPQTMGDLLKLRQDASPAIARELNTRLGTPTYEQLEQISEFALGMNPTARREFYALPWQEAVQRAIKTPRRRSPKGNR